MTAGTIVLLVGGFVVLILGGELLVRGGSNLGRAVGLSRLVIGLTIVAACTSAPEMAVTVAASLAGNPGLAVGNVVGSNIFNVLLILGASAVAAPLIVRSQLVRLDIPAMIGLTVVLLALALDGAVSVLDGVLLLLLLVAYTAWILRIGRRTEAAGAAGPGSAEPVGTPRGKAVLASVGLIAVGVALLVVGARWLVDAAVTVAGALGVSDLVIGLTVVAAGTSLPELATSVIAALRGERDIAVGNIVGSNIFNIGSVLGVAAVVSDGGVPVAASVVRFDLPVALAVAVALLPLAFTGFVLHRWEGALLVAYYGVYVVYLLLDAGGHDALPAFSATMIGFVLPLTALTLLTLAVYEWGRHRGTAAIARHGDGDDGP
ncbi:calcium/sodium antiporter [Blastococcus sp. PRF04-17]|uniref:calcium/sodium antiporter n=1 Tax=Blastococcus sp. PRF04-17 TaxID=2933797 RepID=UPI001FF51B17|nr:calcium/sodium antiporter [Blastococcus sp. PRF04-17]UOX99967.1 calcium/sodium antiporter [Blastococcus sp. PRF04-17]